MFMLDQNSLILVIGLSVLALVITKLAIDNLFIWVASLPTYLFAALYANYWMRELGFAPSPDKVVNLAFACGMGFMAGIVVLVLAHRLGSALFAD